jgi:hypothetical protein
VSEGAASRLRQMKSIANGFECEMTGWRLDKSDRQPLRLLTKELYRYQPKTNDILDGAVFAYAMGTDPEMLLLVEARQVKEQRVWEYAFVPQTSGGLMAKWNGKTVWESKPHPDRSSFLSGGYTIRSPARLSIELERIQQELKTEAAKEAAKTQ